MFSFKEKKAQKGFPSVDFEQKRMIGQGLNFASSEAYKLLRTNLMFSFVDSDAKRVIGITSSVKGEGKSITSINLAYAIAETGKRVLLYVDGLDLGRAPELEALKELVPAGNELYAVKVAPRDREGLLAFAAEYGA